MMAKKQEQVRRVTKNQLRRAVAKYNQRRRAYDRESNRTSSVAHAEWNSWGNAAHDAVDLLAQWLKENP